MDNCIFCKIARKEIPVIKIYEDKDFLVFLDSFPFVEGQTLVIPKKHTDYLFNLRDEDYIRLMLVAKKIAKAIDKELKPIRTGLVVEGLEVNHVHVKLFPLNKGFMDLKPIAKSSEKEMKVIADRIRSKL